MTIIVVPTAINIDVEQKLDVPLVPCFSRLRLLHPLEESIPTFHSRQHRLHYHWYRYLSLEGHNCNQQCIDLAHNSRKHPQRRSRCCPDCELLVVDGSRRLGATVEATRIVGVGLASSPCHPLPVALLVVSILCLSLKLVVLFTSLPLLQFLSC